MLTRRTVLKEMTSIIPATLVSVPALSEEQWVALDGEPSRAQLMDAALAVDVAELGPITKSEQESLALWAGFYFPTDALYDKILKSSVKVKFLELILVIINQPLHMHYSVCKQLGLRMSRHRRDR